MYIMKELKPDEVTNLGGHILSYLKIENPADMSTCPGVLNEDIQAPKFCCRSVKNGPSRVILGGTFPEKMNNSSTIQS